ncbi:hypothetical protein J6590_079065 [Homalodisca vitripennis]|nr:hypothetical protein J6590_079065 [Homalodisca vitripennis]
MPSLPLQSVLDVVNDVISDYVLSTAAVLRTRRVSLNILQLCREKLRGITLPGVPMAEWSKTLDFESELKIAQARILSVTVALFISTIDLVLYRLSPLFCLIRSSHRPVAHENGQNKARRRSASPFNKKKVFCIILCT